MTSISGNEMDWTPDETNKIADSERATKKSTKHVKRVKSSSLKINPDEILIPKHPSLKLKLFASRKVYTEGTKISLLCSSLTKIHLLDVDWVAQIAKTTNLAKLNQILTESRFALQSYLDAHPQSHISLKMLNEMIATGFVNLRSGESAVVKLADLKKKFLILKDSTGSFEVLRKVELLGLGGFGIARSYTSLLTEKEMVLKLAHPNIEAMKKIKNELAILTLLHTDSKNRFIKHLEGIQDTPHCFVVIREGSKNILENSVGFMGKRYDGNGWVLEKSKTCRDEVALDVMRQLFRGLNHLQSKYLSHGDINTSNLLVKLPRTVHLADFGEACFVRNIHDVLQLKSQARWNEYMLERDQEVLSELIIKYEEFCELSEKDQGKEQNQLLEKIRNWVFARDLYACCFILCELIIGTGEWLRLQHILGFNKSVEFENFLSHAGISSALINLFQKAFDQDYEKRPTVREFLAQL